MDGRERLYRRLRAAAALILVALYALGLIAMLTSRVQAALVLWVVSTLGGIGLLYWIHTAKKRAEAGNAAEGSARGPEDR